MHENRETSETPAAQPGSRSAGEGSGRKARVHVYYGEPPEWFYPVRESLGGALMLNGEAERAEAVFRADLEQYPRNPRSLFGLVKSLEAQKKSANVEEVRREFKAAWKNADVPLELGDL